MIKSNKKKSDKKTAVDNTDAILDKCGVIDLFCGVGGLTNGFIQESFEVLAGYDIDESCKFAYESNNNSEFVKKDVKDISKLELESFYGEKEIKILVGCAPCQPFSSYNFKNEDSKKWYLLDEFARLIKELQPDIVSMENVPQLLNFTKASVFQDFEKTLTDNKYFVDYKVVDCPRYGIPQNRKRLVLLASKHGEIKLIPETHTEDEFVTVEDTIRKLAPLEHGEQSKSDLLHRVPKLKPINLKRIQQSKPGGTWRDWDDNLKLKCHLKSTGKTYVSVYGRMKWEEPAPTITTQCYGIGNGRFGHPEQDRAISLREAALLQTFPEDYKFIEPEKPLTTSVLGTHIGNAVPPKLGRIIAQSIKKHLQNLT